MKKNKILIPLIAVVVLALVLAIVELTVGKKEDTTADSSGEITVNSDAYSDDENSNKYKLFNSDFAQTELESGTIDYIKINSSGEAYSFEKQDDVWYVEGNHSVSVSTASVNTLAASLSGVGYIEAFSDGSIAAADCGITFDSNYVTFKGNIGEITIYRGMDTPNKLQTYIMTNLSDTVYLSNANYIKNIFKPLSAYRHSASLNINFDNLSTITIKNGDTISLKKIETNADDLVFNSWRMTAPVEIGARDDQITALLIDPLKKIVANDCVSDNGDFKNYGLEAKDKYVNLTDTSGKSQTLYFSAQTDGQYYISIDENSSIYSVSYESAPYTELKIGDIFERNIHLVKMANISTVTLKGSGYDYKVEFGKKDGKVNGTTVDSNTMNYQVFPAVCGILADDILTEAQGEAKVTLTFNYTNAKKDVITFADYDERYYSVSKNGTVKYKILKAKISELAIVLDECK